MALASAQTDVQQLSRQLNLSTDLSVLERAWQTEIGALGGAVRLAALDRTTLIVEAVSSAALQEISLRRRELLRRLNKHFLKPWIEQLTVRMTNGHESR